jgi:hypothetical protein
MRRAAARARDRGSEGLDDRRTAREGIDGLVLGAAADQQRRRRRPWHLVSTFALGQPQTASRVCRARCFRPLFSRWSELWIWEQKHRAETPSTLRSVHVSLFAKVALKSAMASTVAVLAEGSRIFGCFAEASWQMPLQVSPAGCAVASRARALTPRRTPASTPRP